MKELIQKLQDTDGPSRKLAAEIALTIGLAETYCPPEHLASEKPVVFSSLRSGRIRATFDEKYFHDYPPVSNFTSSIDAAMTLIPDGYVYLLSNMDSILDDANEYEIELYKSLPKKKIMQGHYEGECVAIACAPTAPLAICIAALKAREVKTD